MFDEIRPQVSGMRRMTLAAWAEERRAVEADSAGYFQAGSIWVASCPLISDIGKEWWLSRCGNCFPHQLQLSTCLLAAHRGHRHCP